MSKEVWVYYYDQALNEGKSESSAIEQADEKSADHQARLIDEARDRKKYESD